MTTHMLMAQTPLMTNTELTLAEENWRQAIEDEIRKRISWGPYVDENKKSPYLAGTVDNPYDPAALTKKQLESILREVVGMRTNKNLALYAATFGVIDPHGSR